MNDRALQLALREWHAHIVRPTTLAMLVGVAMILAVSGPFGTGDVMRVVPAFAYWAFVVVVSYSAGFVLNASTQIAGNRRNWPVPPTVALGAVLTGGFVAAFVLATNYVVFGRGADPSDLPEFLSAVFAISFIVSILAEVLSPDRRSSTGSPAPPSVLQRLPLDSRGNLLALKVEDHYVRVITDKGEELVLMRLGDAIKKVGDTAGAQVHRSYWVAWGAVASVRRNADRAILTLNNGTDIPVSRANLPKLRDAGLLPK